MNRQRYDVVVVWVLRGVVDCHTAKSCGRRQCLKVA